ncbi:MAG: LUD domain-containing protein [Actinobacteria bacterium]|nr:LUD domain-containing protein [Actinomycetota bacterium]
MEGLIPIDFEEKVRKAIRSPDHLRNMRKAFKLVVKKQEDQGYLVPDLDERKSLLREVRKSSLGNRDLHVEATQRLQENGFRLMFAQDADEAVSLVVDELEGRRLLVKSKTNISKEIKLAGKLKEIGIEMVETDIGDRIIQLSGDEAVHPTGPSAHLSRYEISKILSEKLGENIEPDPYALIEAVQRDIRDAIARSDVGLSGVNAIAAFEGSIVLVNNELNIEAVSMLGGKHIILASKDKIYPTIEDALNMIKLQTFYATGEQLTSSVRIVSGPSKTADIEKKLFRGVQGPDEMVIIFVDNGRTEVLEDDTYRELLSCIGCGACLLECPAYDVVGPVFGMSGRLGGSGVVLSGCYSGLEAAVENGLNLCTSCGACVARCPVEIKIDKAIESARSGCVESGLLVPEHMLVIDNLKKEQNVFGEPRERRADWAAGLEIKNINDGVAQVFFHAGCRYSYDEEQKSPVRAAVQLLKIAGVDFAVAGAEECCCGGRAYKMGYFGEAEHYAEDMDQKVKASGASLLVTPCADCYACFKYLYPKIGRKLPVEIMHTTEFLNRLAGDEKLLLGNELSMKVTYHDPCNLGRAAEEFMQRGDEGDAPDGESGSTHNGIDGYGPPRELINKIPGLRFAEMDRVRNYSRCCGAGGGVMEAFPGLCAWIAGDRVEEAVETGAQALVTSCPWCEKAFLDATRGSDAGIKILDICELLLMGTGLEKE